MKYYLVLVFTGVIRILVLSSGIMVSNICQAQKNMPLDSMLDKLKNSSNELEKINSLLSISSYFMKLSNFAESKKYGEEALFLAQKYNFKKEWASACFNLARILGSEKNYVEGLKYHQQALLLRRQINDSFGMAESYFYIGLNYKTQGNNDSAIDYLILSVKMWKTLGDNVELSKSHIVLAGLLEQKSKFIEALTHYKVALKLNTELEDKKELATLYNNMGMLYKKLGNYPEALANYLHSIKLREELGDKMGIGLVLLNVGNIYLAQKKFTEALNYYNQSLKYGNKSILAATYNNLGEAYTGLDEFTLAKDNLMLAKGIYEEIGNKKALANCLRSIGHVWVNQCLPIEAIKYYLDALKINLENENRYEIAFTSKALGNAYICTKEFDNAKQHLILGLKIAHEIGAKALLEDIYANLEQLETETGNYEQALKYNKLYSKYRDSLINENSAKQIVLLKEQYESERKDKEIELLTNEKSILENRQKINALLIKAKQDSLIIANADKEKVKTENEKMLTLNLFNKQQLQYLINEKRIQELQNEKDKAEVERNQEQLALLSKEKKIQELELKKEKQTKYYFIIGIFLFLILFYFIYINYQSRQEVKLLKLRNKIAIDLHDDVGSTLSSISMFSQMAQSQSKDYIPALETIGESSRKMLEAMSDIVWSIKPENDLFEKVVMHMREFAYQLLGARNIEFEFEADDEISRINLPMDTRKNLYLIFKEATNNMAKYSNAKNAKFLLKGEKDKLIMTICDDGKGFDSTTYSRGNGLINMKNRAVEIGANLWIDSNPGSGTMISLVLAI